MMKPIISIIVPVYNTDKYLQRCLDSLCRQSMSEIEVILIDNASTDRSGAICDDYAGKDAQHGYKAQNQQYIDGCNSLEDRNLVIQQT